MSIRVERDGPVTTVILDRPGRRHAVDHEHAERLAEAFRDFEADDEARAGVLWGTEGTFCAGADLKAIADGEPNRVEPEGDGPMGPTRMRLDKPVVAAISGHAVAGGLELALWCDMRVVEEGSTLGVFCRRWGVPLIDGGTVRLPRLIGLSHALDLILTGRAVDAEEARRMGLANRVVPEGESREEAETLARQIADVPQTCLRNDRHSVYEQTDLSFEEALRNEFERGRKSLEADGLDGAGRFADGENVEAADSSDASRVDEET
jgi:enoyl-CoA hydratase